jgi:putative endonuclease
MGAKYTAIRRPVQMVYAEEHGSLTSAIKRERQVKRWTVRKKEALITGKLGPRKAFGRQ